MKFKVTKKEMKNNYYYIISAGYCALQGLLYFKQPMAYGAGVYGWSCDYYDIDGVLISTGYSPISTKNTIADYLIINEYNSKAWEIIQDYSISRKEREERVNSLLKEFILKSKINTKKFTMKKLEGTLIDLVNLKKLNENSENNFHNAVTIVKIIFKLFTHIDLTENQARLFVKKVWDK